MVFPQSGRLWCFPKGNKGVFRTTGDRGQKCFGGLLIPYGYPKFSHPLQNRRLLPLRLYINFSPPLNSILYAILWFSFSAKNKYPNCNFGRNGQFWAKFALLFLKMFIYCIHVLANSSYTYVMIFKCLIAVNFGIFLSKSHPYFNKHLKCYDRILIFIPVCSESNVV